MTAPTSRMTPEHADPNDLARVIDPEAFEDHPIEQRRPLAAIQWAARRQIATDHAERVAAHLAAPDNERQCALCGDVVGYLSSRDRCDGCETAHAQVSDTRREDVERAVRTAIDQSYTFEGDLDPDVDQRVTDAVLAHLLKEDA